MSSTFALTVALCLFAGTTSFEIPELNSRIDKNGALTGLLNQIVLERFAYVSPTAGVDSQACIDEQKEKMNALNDKYLAQYDVCEKNNKDANDALQAQLNTTRTSVAQRGGAACVALDACENITDGLEFLSCYEAASKDSSETLRKVSMETATQEQVLRNKFTQIDLTAKECFSTALYEFYSEMYEILAEQEACLTGKTTTPAPTTEPPTTEPPTTEPPTTEPPTTEPPTTEAPTTEAPSTEAPTTEPPTTEPPTTEAPTTEPPTTEPPTPSPETTEVPTASTEEPTPSTETPEPDTTQELLPEEDLDGEEPYNNSPLFRHLRRW